MKDGGSAFPRANSFVRDEDDSPSTVFHEGQTGMTLRQWYAGMALQGLLADPNGPGKAVIVKEAFEIADAMISREEWERQINEAQKREFK